MVSLGLCDLALGTQQITQRGSSEKNFLYQWRKRKHNLLKRIPFYPFLFRAPIPQNFSMIPTDPWPGQMYLGNQLLEGKMILHHKTLSVTHLWEDLDHESPEEALLSSSLHTFGWLRDLRSIGDNTARRLACRLIQEWIDHYPQWTSLSWNPFLTSQRVAHWIGLYDFFMASVDPPFMEKFLRSLGYQMHHLKRSWSCGESFIEQALALYSLILGSLAFGQNTEEVPHLLKIFEKIVIQQILPDGGHETRLPLVQLTLLRLLIDLRSLLRQAHLSFSPVLQQIIGKMAPILRLFRLSDGSLACFGPYEGAASPSFIDMVLSLADAKGRPPFKAPYSGYERMTSQSGMLLINTHPFLSSSLMAHSPMEEGIGIFNFEWSCAQQRIITHGECILASSQSTRHQASFSSQARWQSTQRHHKEGVIFEGFYQEGRTFRLDQTFFLNNSQFDFRGEVTVHGGQNRLMAMRFLFHPRLSLHQTSSNRVMIQVPEGGRWLFLASGHEEIYLDSSFSGLSPVPVLMILSETAPQHSTLKWAFSQVN